MKILSIVDSAYRATLEEQDDTSLWFNHACKNGGLDIDILLSGNAVNYLVKSQNPQPIFFGKSGVEHPNKFHEDIENYLKTGAKVFFVQDDCKERGINQDSLISGAESISRHQLAGFVDTYESIWHW